MDVASLSKVRVHRGISDFVMYTGIDALKIVHANIRSLQDELGVEYEGSL